MKKVGYVTLPSSPYALSLRGLPGDSNPVRCWYVVGLLNTVASSNRLTREPVHRWARTFPGEARKKETASAREVERHRQAQRATCFS